jgi:hypothetical protein
MDKLKEYYNMKLKGKIESSVENVKAYPLGLDENITRMKNSIDKYSRKEINLNFIERFTRILYANPYHLAKLEFLQYIIFIGLIYFYNPLNISTKYPAFTRILMLMVAFGYIILFIFIKMKVEKGEDVDLIAPTESNVITQILSIIVFFILFMLLIKGVIWILINTAVIDAVRRMLGLFIAVGVLGIVYLIMRKTINKAKNAPGRKLTTLFLKIIMYLPCLLVDIVEYIKYEFHLTTKPIWLLLGAEVGVGALYFVVPFLFDKIMTADGTKLLNKPIYLDNEHTLGTYQELHKDKNLSDNELTKVSKLYSPNIDQAYSDEENVSTRKSIDQKNNEESNVYTDPNMPKNEYLAWIYNKLKHPTWLKVEFSKHPDYTDSNTSRYRYAYSLSGWFNINPQPPNTRSAYTTYTNILKYGDKVQIQYNGKLGSLRVMAANAAASAGNGKGSIDSSNNDLIEIYETKNVLYQRWNNIVINYNKGHLDVFLNGELVGTLPGIVPYMTFDSITTGSPNGILGGICNVSYYDKPLTKNKIELTYKALSKKDLPYVGSIKDDINLNIKSTGTNQTFINEIKQTFGFKSD